ncbi:MAG: hypothetical protein IPM34_01635 [Saprospiraceae bacterium]|nr:hypothetical protein [Saprospiraceae bacterium]
MNPIHLHLLVNHVPIFAVLFGLALMVYGLFFKNRVVQMTALFFFVFGALSALPANQSGESAEDAIENIAGIDHQIVEEHEESTKPFFIGTVLLGVVSLITLFLHKKQKAFASKLHIPLAIMAMVLGVFAYQAGVSGGKIRRPDLRDGAGSIQMQPAREHGED